MLELTISLLSLTLLEIILGIDNILFIAIISEKAKKEDQAKARTIGMALALLTRIGLLTAISWLASLQNPLCTIANHAFSIKDLVLLGGGFFLLWKSANEIYGITEGEHNNTKETKAQSLPSIITQIILIDIIFSLDSVITAVGIANNLNIMISAIVISMVIMIWASKSISEFVNKHPSLKMLSLSFLCMIGSMLVAEGLGQHISKSTIYFAMGFSFVVELLNLRHKKNVQKRVNP
jgi:predicted tellurium resistance membrane protein TerC